MSGAMKLEKYSLGVGDRFAHQAQAQLSACVLAEKAGVEVIPVWNKSNREHTIIGSDPRSTRLAADAAVIKLGWKKHYYCDADHINQTTLERFLDSCDFYTIDVADQIGQRADRSQIEAFVERHPELTKKVQIEGRSFSLSRPVLENLAGKYLAAVKQAAAIYKQIEASKGEGNFITEVSMDETDVSADACRTAGDPGSHG